MRTVAQDLLDLVEVRLVADQRRGELDDRVAAVVGAAVEARVVSALERNPRSSFSDSSSLNVSLVALSLTSSMP